MPAIEVGRVCVKIAGREAGEKCVIVEVIDDKFVEVVGTSIKNRRCNIRHLEPIDQTVEIKSEDIEEIKKNCRQLLLKPPNLHMGRSYKKRKNS